MPVPTRLGTDLHGTPSGPVALFPRLRGHRMDPDRPAHLEAFGAALWALHAALASLPPEPKPGFPSYGDLHDLYPSSGTGPAEPALRRSWTHVMERTGAFATGIYPDLPRQLIHGDSAPSNVLMNEHGVSAVLDFEFSTLDARLMDLATGLRHVLRVHQDRDRLAQARAFLRGYARPLTPLEVRSLPDAMLLSETVPALWWWGRALAGEAPLTDDLFRGPVRLHAWLNGHAADVVSLAAELSDG